jgi:hypothetical protein
VKVEGIEGTRDVGLEGSKAGKAVYTCIGIIARFLSFLDSLIP